jgi:hypothetical protein
VRVGQKIVEAVGVGLYNTSCTDRRMRGVMCCGYFEKSICFVSFCSSIRKFDFLYNK